MTKTISTIPGALARLSRRAGHALGYGETGSGMSLLAAHWANSALEDGHEVIFIDTVHRDLTHDLLPGVTVVNDRIAAADILGDLSHAESSRRQQILNHRNALRFDEVPVRTKLAKHLRPITVIISDLFYLFEGSKRDELSARIDAHISTLVRIGRFIDISVRLCEQHLDAETISGELRANVEMTVLLFSGLNIPSPAYLRAVFGPSPIEPAFDALVDASRSAHRAALIRESSDDPVSLVLLDPSPDDA
jgi:hypothetical protein